MTPAHKPQITPKAIAYALRLYSKGYSVAEIAFIVGVSTEEMWKVIDQQVEGSPRA